MCNIFGCAFKSGWAELEDIWMTFVCAMRDNNFAKCQCIPHQTTMCILRPPNPWIQFSSLNAFCIKQKFSDLKTASFWFKIFLSRILYPCDHLGWSKGAGFEIHSCDGETSGAPARNPPCEMDWSLCRYWGEFHVKTEHYSLWNILSNQQQMIL